MKSRWPSSVGSTTCLPAWCKEVDARGEAAFTDRTNNSDQNLEQRIAELERFCGQLSLENTILKKSLATYDFVHRDGPVLRE